MKYLVEIPNNEDLEILLTKHAELFGLVAPEKYARKWLKDLNSQQKMEIASRFRIIKENYELLAGAFLHPAGWLGELFLAKGHEDAFDALIKEILLEGQYFINFRTIPPSLQSILVLILEANGYKMAFGHDLSLNLLDFQTPKALGFEPIVWSEEFDHIFEEVYNKYHPEPWPWEMMKYQTGGGMFSPELWFIHPDFLGIVGLNQPRNELMIESKVFNLVVALGEDEITSQLVQYAIWQAAMTDPIGVVNTHILDRDLSFYQTIGFTIGESHLYYYPSGHMMFEQNN